VLARLLYALHVDIVGVVHCGLQTIRGTFGMCPNTGVRAFRDALIVIGVPQWHAVGFSVSTEVCQAAVGKRTRRALHPAEMRKVRCRYKMRFLICTYFHLFFLLTNSERGAIHARAYARRCRRLADTLHTLHFTSDIGFFIRELAVCRGCRCRPTAAAHPGAAAAPGPR